MAAVKQTFWPKDAQVPRGRPLLEAVGCPGHNQRYSEYLSLREKKQGLDGTFVADLDQWPGGGISRCGDQWPSQLTHGM
eukprot:9017435-Lingulodinium_polyedra.AAC.1